MTYEFLTCYRCGGKLYREGQRCECLYHDKERRICKHHNTCTGYFSPKQWEDAQL